MEFLAYLKQKTDINHLSLSVNAYTFALMTILKTNELARDYSVDQSFKMITDLLDDPCLNNYQVAYNVVCMLWILSYHEFCYKYFEDYTIAIIERVSKIMDFFTKEKNARIMLMLFNNLRELKICQDHLSDIDAISLIVKLQNRHWVDEDINALLDELYKYFDDNTLYFSGIDKFRN